MPGDSVQPNEDRVRKMMDEAQERLDKAEAAKQERMAKERATPSRQARDKKTWEDKDKKKG